MSLRSFIHKKTLPIIQGSPSTFIPMSFVQAFLSGALNATDTKYLEYYIIIPELQAIINYRARVLSSMKIKARKISSGEDIEKLPELELLKKPNPLQGQSEFIKQYSIGRDVFGNTYMHPVFGVSRTKTKAIYNLPAVNAKIIPTSDKLIPFNQTDFNEIIKEYQFQFNGGKIKYKPEEITHLNDNQISYKNDDWMKGKSKIQALTQPCENIKTAYEARGILQGNSPLGVLSNRTKDGMGTTIMDPADKKAVQDDLKKYGLTKEKYKFIVTSADLQWTSMAANIAGLKLFEEVDADQLSIANGFMFPIELFQNNTTFANKKEAKKQLYQDSTIPEAQELTQSLSQMLGLIDRGIELYADFSHIAVLQDDYEKMSTTWFKSVSAMEKAFASGVITLIEYQDNLRKIGML